MVLSFELFVGLVDEVVVLPEFLDLGLELLDDLVPALGLSGVGWLPVGVIIGGSAGEGVTDGVIDAACDFAQEAHLALNTYILLSCLQIQ